ncbi:MAG: hypothetical protein ACO1OB_29850 [Archangium sp.]
MNRAVTAFLAVFSIGCATLPKGDPEELKPAVEAFHQRARWKDFRGAADLLTPDRRGPFIKERSKMNDDKDLFITNFELEDAKIAPDTVTAEVVTKISWYRLPSTSEQTKTVTNVFVWRDSAWLLESQDEGPFEELKPAPPQVGPAPVDTSAVPPGE